MSVTQTVFWCNGLLTRALCAVAVTLIALAMLGICLEVTLRVVGGGSISGLMEGTEYSLFFATFFAAPYLLHANEHIRVDIVMSRLPEWQRMLCDQFVQIVIMVISVVLLIVSARILVFNFREGMLVFKDIVFPHWWLDWVIPLSALAIGLQAFEKFLQLRRAACNASHEV